MGNSTVVPVRSNFQLRLKVSQAGKVGPVQLGQLRAVQLALSVVLSQHSSRLWASFEPATAAVAAAQHFLSGSPSQAYLLLVQTSSVKKKAKGSLEGEPGESFSQPESPWSKSQKIKEVGHHRILY